jgi:DNA polymerase III subunit delta'
MSSDLPEPDRVEGAPHPRETLRLFGQARAEAGFLDAYASGRMHSGWLITGPRGIGKATLAWRIATFLLAEPAQDAGLFADAAPAPASLAVSPDHPDARLVQSGAHPRLFILRRGPNEKGDALSAQITVDPVRRLKNFFHLSAADGGRRVVIVDSADDMNRNAANALLKELEEPPARTTLLLISHQPSRLLPTIRSRCRELRCEILDSEAMQLAIAQAGVDLEQSHALGVLSGGSVGGAIALANMDGLALYGALIQLFAGLPRFDRLAALKLAESCTGRPNEPRFALTLDLIDIFLARVARAGLLGPPQEQGAPGEALLLARLAPDDRAARRWAQLAQDLGARARHGKAVNLDPAALILDMVFKIEETAQGVAAA